MIKCVFTTAIVESFELNIYTSYKFLALLFQHTITSVFP